MPPAAPRARTPVRAWRAARAGVVRPTGIVLLGLVAVLVVGILAMHALNSHGTPAAASAVVAHATADQHAAPDTAMPDGDLHAGDAHAAHSYGESPGDGSGHGLGGMVGLCGVMLAAAALALLALLVTGLVRRARITLLDPRVTRARPPRWVRGNGPPPVWRFSVIRC